MREYKLAPSILAADFARLGEEIAAVEDAGARYLHVDVMDGVFVPNISVGIPVVEKIRPRSRLVFDVHLMIVNPERHIEAFANAGADIICVHAEAVGDLRAVIRQIKAFGKRAAVAVKPATPADELYPVLDELDMALIMSVEPGFGGQKLMPSALAKAKALFERVRERNLDVDIEMDGGIGPQNLRDVLDSGVNVVVAGSSVFNGKPKEATREFLGVFREYEP